MFQISSALTSFTAAPLQMISGITSMVTGQINGRQMLYTATRAGGGILAFDVTGGAMNLVSQVSLPVGQRISAKTVLELRMLGSEQHLVITGLDMEGLYSRKITANGALGAENRTPFDLKDVTSAQAFHEYLPYVFTAQMGANVITTWARNPQSGALRQSGQVSLGADGVGINVSVLESLRFAGKDFVLALDQGRDRLVVMQFVEGTGLEARSTFGAANGWGVDAPSMMKALTLYGRQFIVVGSTNSASLSVLELATDGIVTLRDHVIDTAFTRFAALGAFEQLTINGRGFVFAAGRDKGLSMFEILPDGHLILMGNFSFEGQINGNIIALQLEYSASAITAYFTLEGTGIFRTNLSVRNIAAPILGNTGADSLVGTLANDLLIGGAGNDSLFGGAGDDVLVDGTGRDRLSGGAGRDLFVLAADGQEDVVTDYQPGQDRFDLSAWGRIYSLNALTITTTSWGATIRFGAELLHVYSAGGGALGINDFKAAGIGDVHHFNTGLTAASRHLRGTEYADLLVGGNGNDTFYISGGLDTLEGGGGVDLVDMSALAIGVALDLERGVAHGGPITGQVFRDIDQIVGTAGDDWLAGTAQANFFWGNAGNDRLYGRAGNDRLYGGLGDDTLSGGMGADHLEGGLGSDWAIYDDSPIGHVIDLILQTNNTGFAAGDSLIGIEHIRGSAFGDRIFGDFGDNWLQGDGGHDVIYGRIGDDTLEGGAGNDTLDGGPGGDVLDGGAGHDVVTYAEYLHGLVIDMTTPSRGTFAAYGDVFYAIETVIGTRFSDQISGTEGAETLYGGAGHDILWGRAGADRLFGDAGDDLFYGGLGIDHYFGGLGFDTVDYGEMAFAIKLDLLFPQNSTGPAFAERFSAIELIAGTAFDDQIWGDFGANVLLGQAGNDRLFGRAGNDHLQGGAGHDHLDGGLGADVLDGGPGIDWALYSNSSTGLRIDLQLSERNTGEAAGDRFISIENLQGSGFDDTLFGDALGNILQGGAGNDHIEGRFGHDQLYGGYGRDRLNGGVGNDTLYGGFGFDVFAFGSGHDIIADFTVGQDRIVLEKRLFQPSLSDIAKVEQGGIRFTFDASHSLVISDVFDVSSVLRYITWG